ncbi:hypothetical protein EYB25_005347 [Talaromyces marneffei]|nr:hypothetical protein EYB25_005347 [Talaromyces marneffei]
MNQVTISSDSDSDASMFASTTATTNRHPNPPQSHSHHHHHHHHHHQHHHPTTLPTNNNTSSTTNPSSEKRKTTTHRTHETIHITNTILSSKELLVLHSLAANESVPRTRRRFMAQVLEPGDSVRASKLVWDRPKSDSVGSTAGRGDGGATTVGGLQVAPGNIIEVVETDDLNGWERLRTRKSAGGSGGSSPMARKISSPGGSKKGQQQHGVVSGSPLSSPVVRRRGRREDADGDVDMDIS